MIPEALFVFFNLGLATAVWPFNWIYIFDIAFGWPHNNPHHNLAWNQFGWLRSLCLNVKIVKSILDERDELYDNIFPKFGPRGYLSYCSFQLLPYFLDLTLYKRLSPWDNLQVASFAVEEDDSARGVQESTDFRFDLVLHFISVVATDEERKATFHQGQLGLVSFEAEHVPVVDEVRDAAQALEVHAIMLPEGLIVDPFLHYSLDVRIVLGLPLVQKLFYFSLRPLEDLGPFGSEVFLRC